MFEQKDWKDRVTEYPTRRNLVKEDGDMETVTVERNEGNVSQEGDAFSAENMNGLEQRIGKAFSECPTSAVIRDIQVVEALPEDAAQHSDTLYIIAG